MRSGFLILLAAALGVSAGPIVTGTKADAWAQCGDCTGIQAECPSGYTCVPANKIYEQCVPNSYSKRDAGIGATGFEPPPPDEQSTTVAKRQTSSSTLVGGAKSINGKCYHRFKIQTLKASYPYQWNMFLCALEDLQKQPETNNFSWFGISGIHGAPYVSWPRGSTGNFNQGMGYCVHRGPLFTFWHRPYTLLLEQALQARAVAIAAKFTGSRAADYRTGADQLRLPYWDWSDGNSNIPDVLMQASISITKPSSDGTPVSSTFPNPLFRYNFQSTATLQQYFSGNFANWRYTTRQPRSSSDPTPNNSGASSMMQSGYTTRRAQTYRLFSLTSFNGMADSLEGIHNSIHTTLGGSNPLGHMSTTSVASFDPIFWLHHCNIDRLVALYQAIYPDNRLQPSPGRATFGRVVPGIDGPDDNLFTNLYPFKLPSGVWWQANEIKSVHTIWKYHFGYDEIPCSMYNVADRPTISAFTRTKVNALYGDPPSGPSKKIRRSAGPKAIPEANAYALADPKKYPHQPGYTPKPDKRVIARNDYGIRCMIDSAEIPGCWTGHIMFTPEPCGKVSPGDYFLAKERIGGFAGFGTPLVRMQSMAYSQEYPITANLIERGVKISNVAAVEKYLKDNLKVCFTTGDDTLYEIPASSLKTWRIGVYRQEAKYPEGLRDGTTLPTYGEKKYMLKVTKGMPGGITTKREMDYPQLLNGKVEDLEGDKDTY